MIRIPTKIKELIGKQSYAIDDVGKSNASILCFENMVLKVEKECGETNNEHRMMKWMKDKLPVPEVICLEKEDGMNYLLMSKIEGDMGRSKKLLANPQELAKIAANGLKKLWCVNIQECPYDITLEHKLKLAEKNVNEGRINIWKFVCLNMSIMSRYNCFYNTQTNRNLNGEKICSKLK